MEKEKILKQINDLKNERSKVIKEKHASPKDIIKRFNDIDARIERLELQLKEKDKIV